MGRPRTVNLDLPRRLARDQNTGNLRYKRPDNGRYIYLSQYPEDTARALADVLNEAFGPCAPRGRKQVYRHNFTAHNWSAVEPSLLSIIAARLPDILPMQKGLAVQEQIRHSWAYAPPQAAALRSGLKPLPEAASWTRPLWAAAKKNAAARGIAFDLTEDDVAQMVQQSRGRCAVTGIAMSIERGALPIGRKMRRPWAPSIDRIQSSDGYSRENCRIVCCAANYAMSQWGEAVLIEMAKAIARKRIAKLDRVV